MCPLHRELLGPRTEGGWRVEELGLYWCIEEFIFLYVFGEAKVGENKKQIEMHVGKKVKI